MTTRCSLPKQEKPSRACAFFWDESFLWGLMARRALIEAGLCFDLIRSDDIRAGALSRYRMLFVPGGWASQKIEALWDMGREAIKSFVRAGGSYLGICGGAGMATEDGIGLLPVRRKRTSERVPSFSGPIRLCRAEHAIWKGAEQPVFNAWWPSQFRIANQDVRLLARYEEAQDAAFSSDINVAEGRSIGWLGLEQRYGILLDPARLRNDPAVMEGRFGRGRVILSLIHFDTPGDPNSLIVLKNLWDCLAPGYPQEPKRKKGPSGGKVPSDSSRMLQPLIAELQSAVNGLIGIGIRYSLWQRRNSFLLQWRRGVRGLEYATLAAMIGEIGNCLGVDQGGRPDAGRVSGVPVAPVRLREELSEIREQLIPFVERAMDLLAREQAYLNVSSLSPLECDDAKISRLRQELFGSAMSHGGRFRHLIVACDCLLYSLIKGSGE